jgi:hypothetical protein
MAQSSKRESSTHQFSAFQLSMWMPATLLRMKVVRITEPSESRSP